MLPPISAVALFDEASVTGIRRLSLEFPELPRRDILHRKRTAAEGSGNGPFRRLKRDADAPHYTDLALTPVDEDRSD